MDADEQSFKAELSQCVLLEHLGTVKRFSNRKGFGFLICDDGGPDVFVHYSAIQTQTHKSLKKGEAVRFSIVRDIKGARADWVVALRKGICAHHSNSRDCDHCSARAKSLATSGSKR
jgi:CspA family cold shock protein